MSVRLSLTVGASLRWSLLLLAVRELLGYGRMMGVSGGREREVIWAADGVVLHEMFESRLAIGGGLGGGL